MKDTFLPRLCEALVVGKMKQVIINSSSKYQIGGQPGHATDEHIFTVKCVWAMLEKQNTGMIITLVDIVAFFDREDIYDVMQTLHKIGVNRKAARVWYQLNRDTEISVKTASGMTDTALVGDCIGQGTAGGALVSQANLDQGLMEHFESRQLIYMSLMLLIPLIPIAALVTQNMIILNNIMVRKAGLMESDLSVLKSDEQVDLCGI